MIHYTHVFLVNANFLMKLPLRGRVLVVWQGVTAVMHLTLTFLGNASGPWPACAQAVRGMAGIPENQAFQHLITLQPASQLLIWKMRRRIPTQRHNQQNLRVLQALRLHVQHQSLTRDDQQKHRVRLILHLVLHIPLIGRALTLIALCSVCDRPTIR